MTKSVPVGTTRLRRKPARARRERYSSGVRSRPPVRTSIKRSMEANQNQKRDEWMSALDKMESLKPRIVVAGHKNMKNDDDGHG